MPGAPYYAEAFFSLPGRCFRMVAHPGEAGPSHCLSGDLARVLAGAQRPPLPDRGLRGPRAATVRGQRPHRLDVPRLVGVELLTWGCGRPGAMLVVAGAVAHAAVQEANQPVAQQRA